MQKFFVKILFDLNKEILILFAIIKFYLTFTPEFLNSILIMGTQQYNFREAGIFVYFREQ